MLDPADDKPEFTATSEDSRVLDALAHVHRHRSADRPTQGLRHISPYPTEHINRFGEYWTHEVGIRPEAYTTPVSDATTATCDDGRRPTDNVVIRKIDRHRTRLVAGDSNDNHADRGFSFIAMGCPGARRVVARPSHVRRPLDIAALVYDDIPRSRLLCVGGQLRLMPTVARR
ncbi:transposase [Streptomyces sp. SID3343]|uniref:transposase n=1 Tax=Streptomyces sp. SID3343 TaxID=2690260 RepID=UPI00136FC2C5|nr:transposase [Streptomyces sp. SID3343]